MEEQKSDIRYEFFSNKKNRTIEIKLSEKEKAAILEGTNLLGWMNHGGWSKTGGW